MLKAEEIIAHSPFENLTGVSFKVDSGELVAVLGDQDCGKHLLGQVLSGQANPKSGRVVVNHYQLGLAGMKARRQIGYLPNPVTIEPFLSGFEYLDLLGSIYRLSPEVRLNRIKQLMNDLDFNQEAYTLGERTSAATRQKIALSAALMHQPHLLVLDEPLINLDFDAGQRTGVLIENARRDGAAVVLITDNLSLAEDWADRLILLSDGQVAAEGSLKELRNQTRTPSRDLIGVYEAVLSG